MFNTLLIANRGEIACRVAATARRLGLRTVAVYSDADAQARHVAACDMAVHIGGPEPRASYLRADAILQAARDTGAQAIHPGYGFLSENAGFAQAASAAGIVFVGPPASAIAAMGSKSAAKALMARAGVPLVPGYHGDDQTPSLLHAEADKIGYPVLIKASAGGGGKGMRVVTASGEFLEALASCQREARTSFGDDRVLLERYLQKPRHIEIQVFADSHGQCVYLFERDCSVQRRHQKVIEEAPAPGMTPERREAMGQAAVAAARAVGYVGAGTVEFIVEPDGRFYFMEMNTRLQVEHPVTEMITGLDLVEWQLRVAAGQALPLTQAQLRFEGHAIEARIYAENPDKGFLPSIGTLNYLTLPPHSAFANGDIRVDGGVRMGDTITPFYDPMIAKLIVRGADRQQARARMVQALAQTQAVGVQTNVAFLTRLMQDSAFASADLDTGLIERQRDTLLPAPGPASRDALALASVAVLASEGLLQDSQRGAGAHTDPWAARDGWRLSGRYRRVLQWQDQAACHDLALSRDPQGWTLDCDGTTTPVRWQVQPDDHGVPAYHLQLTLDGHDVRATVVLQGDRAHVLQGDTTTQLERRDTQTDTGHEGQAGGLTAPMPGKIIAIAVAMGERVEKGQALLVMEAMKMEHTITAPAAGVVSQLCYAVGDQVAEGVALIALATGEAA